MSDLGDPGETLEQGMVDEITLVSPDDAWRPQVPTLEPAKPKARCKHPVSFTNWQVDGRWCTKCDTRVAPPR